MFKKKYKSFFNNKICDICGNPATIFRVTKNKTFMLCDGRKCSYISKLKSNLITPLDVEENNG